RRTGPGRSLVQRAPTPLYARADGFDPAARPPHRTACHDRRVTARHVGAANCLPIRAALSVRRAALPRKRAAARHARPRPLVALCAGGVWSEGRDIIAMRESKVRKFRRSAQLVFQDPYASLNPRMTVGDILAEPLALHDIVPAERRRDRVAELLRVVGLEPQ